MRIILFLMLLLALVVPASNKRGRHKIVLRCQTLRSHPRSRRPMFVFPMDSVACLSTTSTTIHGGLL